MKKLLAVLMFAGLFGAALAMPSWSAQITPESVVELFNAQWVIIGFVVGIVWKYVPALKKWTNAAIPWLNAVAFMVVKIATVGSAEAAGFNVASTVPDLVGIAIGGFANAVWARQLYEGFGRSLLERWLKLRKPA